MCYFHTGSSFLKLFPFVKLFLIACLLCCSFLYDTFFFEKGNRGGGGGQEWKKNIQ
jgi:hypothetical protein